VTLQTRIETLLTSIVALQASIVTLLTCNAAMEVGIVISSIDNDLFETCMAALQADIVRLKRETTSPILPETHKHSNQADTRTGRESWRLAPLRTGSASALEEGREFQVFP
jgi:hypothetical protein